MTEEQLNRLESVLMNVGLPVGPGEDVNNVLIKELLRLARLGLWANEYYGMFLKASRCKDCEVCAARMDLALAKLPKVDG